jgi:hypothetical protein
LRILSLDISKFILDDDIRAFIRSYRIHYVLSTRILGAQDRDILDYCDKIFHNTHPVSRLFINWANGAEQDKELMKYYFEDFIRHRMCDASGDLWVEDCYYIGDEYKDKWKFEL